jgi:UDPglucose 6-dehydrogenase
MKAIGVLGQGFVGGSLTTVFAERGFKVYVYDKTGKIATGGDGRFAPIDFPRLGGPTPTQIFAAAVEALKDFSGVFFVCLPTPMFEDGEADLSIVENTLKELSEIKGERIAVVKSTVPPGSVEKWNKQFADTGLRVVFNPEFLTEANALEDMRNQNRIILGGPRPHINKVKLIFQAAFPKVPLIKTSSTTAEMVKYVTNCFLAAKVSFANEMFQVCEALAKSGLDIDYDKVVEYARFDERLGHSHWSVPGPVPTHDGRYVKGFGGHCIVHGTKVKTPQGEKNIEDIRPDTIVASSNYDLTTSENKLVNQFHSRAYNGKVLAFTVSVEGEERTVVCTPEHLLPVKRDGRLQILRACDIVDSDELFVA